MPLRIFILFSGGASLAKWLKKQIARYGTEYVFVGAFTNKKAASGREFFAEENIPVCYLGYKKFCEENKLDPEATESNDQYFSEIAALAKLHNADLILCAGFMKIIPVSFIARFPNRILNVHPADLSKEERGMRLYTGANAVEKAYNAGEKIMNSTIHYVTPEVDGGPIVAISPDHITDFTISWQENQDIMKDACDGPAGAKALHKIFVDDEQLGITELWERWLQ